MKSLLFISLSFFALTSFAQTQGQPFQLNAGSYTSECWTVTVSKNQGGNFIRGQGYEKSNLNIVIKGNTYTEYNQYSGEGFSGNTVTKITTQDLGDGIFKQKTEFTANDIYDGETKTSETKFDSTLEVQDNRTITLTTKEAGKTETPGVTESVWTKMDDGRITVQIFLREKKSSTNSQGDYRESLVNNSFCIYNPQQK